MCMCMVGLTIGARRSQESETKVSQHLVGLMSKMHKAKRKMTSQPDQCSQCVNFDWQCIFNLVAKNGIDRQAF
ncbi:hypothetical protein AO254_22695 [Pseudomonas syringae]|nr:hypothetical protein AO254_22695 [Pseudomonas syringae]